MTPDTVLAMPLGMRTVFEKYQTDEIRAHNKANRR